MTSDVTSTPYLRIHGPRVRRNIERLAAYAAGHGLNVRPHAKTHKSLRLARIQLAAGAAGLTVAKVGEAEIMASLTPVTTSTDDPGRLDILLAYPVVDVPRCRSVAALARSHTLRVATDSIESAAAISAAAAEIGVTVGILIDLDVGMGRTGVQSPEAALALAAAADALPGVRVDGLFCYPGHIWKPPDQQAPLLRAVADRLGQAVELFRRHGLDTRIVSGGSTPTARQSHHIPQLTEIRPGTYIFNDMNTVRGGHCTLDDCAAAVVCTVVSTAVPGQCVVDAGSKALASDRCIPDPDAGYGHVVEFPQARMTSLSEEHGQIDLSRSDTAPRIGDRVTVIPNHICPCLNLHEMAWWAEENGELEPMPIEARGKLA